ncbi:hemolysin III family protein [Gordonia sp. ABSL49_1]|uniref:PAQR family membrane homeostasis protein TrhA n=1 Tax=unclassified Gordonia (in: high G+C Gram-positive bacteria) TaxID=2657482 RepID=UPI001F0D1C71|nr:hemolysin III family protein [Gordonia sp. ABSL49_1]MCH5642103.1 hemolysin III family protein [Gordonia sp. ABSL49_1]
MSTIIPPLPSIPDRPRLRGVIHHYSAYVAAVAGIAVVIGAAMARGAVAAAACAVYAITVFGVFAVSASYHRIPWKTVRAQIRMKRADHSMIFLFIAGTYTPFCAMGLPSPARWWVLGIVWTGAVAGVVLKLLWPSSPRWLGVTLYILLGWVIIAVAPALIAQCGVAIIVLLAVGGALYSIGGILYALRWPNPWPSTFGHHEVFHVCTAVAALLHYIAVWLVIFA